MSSVVPIQSKASPPVRQGPLGKLVSFLLGFGFWLAVGLVGNILLTWVEVGTGQPPARVLEDLEEEISRLSPLAGHALIGDPQAAAARLVVWVHRKVYLPQAAAWLKRASGPAGRGTETAYTQIARRTLDQAKLYLALAVLSLEAYLVRLFVLGLSLPAFLLVGLLALTDGLLIRDLRRFTGARERGQVFHLARRAVGPSFSLPWALYLAWPSPIDPRWVILPFVGLFGLSVWLSAAMFKKYV